MPVQFLSGGGGTSDVRQIFGNPVLADCYFIGSSGGAGQPANQVAIKWTIPANYLQVNDCLCFATLIKRLAGGTTQGTTCFTTIQIRLGTTGTITDTLVAQLIPQIPFGTNTPEAAVFAKGLINVTSIGASGTCIANANGLSPYGSVAGFTNGGSKTIDTTSTLYLTVCLSVIIGGNTYNVTLSPSGSALCVSF